MEEALRVRVARELVEALVLEMAQVLLAHFRALLHLLEVEPLPHAGLAQARADLEHSRASVVAICRERTPAGPGNPLRALAEVRQQPVDRERDETRGGEREAEHGERPARRREATAARAAEADVVMPQRARARGGAR